LRFLPFTNVGDDGEFKFDDPPWALTVGFFVWRRVPFERGLCGDLLAVEESRPFSTLLIGFVTCDDDV